MRYVQNEIFARKLQIEESSAVLKMEVFTPSNAGKINISIPKHMKIREKQRYKLCQI